VVTTGAASRHRKKCVKIEITPVTTTDFKSLNMMKTPSGASIRKRKILPKMADNHVEKTTGKILARPYGP